MIKNIPVSSRDADKFVVRLPDGMRALVTERAEQEHCSMNTVVILALQMYLDKTGRQDALLDALTARLEELKAVQP